MFWSLHQLGQERPSSWFKGFWISWSVASGLTSSLSRPLQSKRLVNWRSGSKKISMKPLRRRRIWNCDGICLPSWRIWPRRILGPWTPLRRNWWQPMVIALVFLHSFGFYRMRQKKRVWKKRFSISSLQIILNRMKMGHSANWFAIFQATVRITVVFVRLFIRCMILANRRAVQLNGWKSKLFKLICTVKSVLSRC